MSSGIDIVVRWVDSNDEKWLNEKKKYFELQNPKKNSGDASNIRYRDYELMRYWFRGIEKYAPWVDKVFFVTCNQVPSWINISCPKLRIVNHDEFIPKKWLPTFSSNTIDLNIHRIEELSEQFVLFDDDMFLLNATKPEDFFYNGLPCDSKVFNIITARASEPISNVVFNNMAIINKYFKKEKLLTTNGIRNLIRIEYGPYLFKNIFLSLWNYYPGFQDFHIPDSLLKSTMRELWELEPEMLEQTCKNKFRKETDLNQWLIRYWQLASGTFKPRNYTFGKYYTLSNDNKRLYGSLKSKKLKVICINDSEAENFEKIQSELISIFEDKFPNKSIYEI